MEVFIGLFLVILAGLGTGTGAWPMKKIKDLHFEQFLFVFIFTGIILYPWLVTLLKISDLAGIIRTVGLRQLLISNLLSICWGVANVLYLICVVRIGAALTGAILSAAGMSVGVIMPMIFKGSGMFGNAPGLLSTAGIVILSGLIVIVIGIALVSAAGFGREKVLQQNAELAQNTKASGSFLKGMILVILAGFLSAGLSLSFVYSQGPVIAAVKEQGSGDMTANFAVWALCMLGGGLVNVFYALFLMAKNNSWKLLFARKDELLYGSIIGLQFIISIILLGRGMLLLGALGASVGFAIQQSLQVIGNQLVGFLGGEWKGIHGKPRNTMYLAIAIILLAVVILAFSNTIK
jgi:L-rhamnose-H+ transport protein